MNMLQFAKCETRPIRIHENKTYSGPHNSDLVPQYASDSLRYDSDDDSAEIAQGDMDLYLPEDLQCFIDEDDADEIFPRILQDDPKFENAPRFADLYYASVQDLKPSSVSHQADERINCSSTCASQYQVNMERKAEGYALLRSGLHHDSISPTRWKSDLSKGPSSFASRVQAKMAAAAEASSGHVDPGSAFNPMMPNLSQHQEQVTEPLEEPEIDDDQLRLSHTLEAAKGVLSRPSILIAKEQQVGATSSESTKSVKERIRELEERQKVLQLNEVNGVRSFV